MPLLAVSAFLGAAIAATAEVIVLRGFDRPMSSEAVSLRFIAIAFVAGQAVLGLVVGLLALTIPVDHLLFPIEPVLPVMLGIGAFGTAFAYRGGAVMEPLDARVRARTIVLMALAESVSIVGVVLAMLALFLGT